MARKERTPNDPLRKERIATAAMDLLLKDGIASVTARAVAIQAGVPVGSVSYHFHSVRSVLFEALERVLQIRMETLEEWGQTVEPATVTRRLAELVHHQLTGGRQLTVLAYELYVLGLRDQEFAALSDRFVLWLRAHLQEHCSEGESQRLVAVADGFQLQSLFAAEAPSVEEIERVLRG